MATNYQIVLRSPNGLVVKIVDDFTALDYARVVNSVGSLTLTLPDRFDTQRSLYTFDLFNQPDARIEVWRQVDGGLPYLDGETMWLVDYAERTLSDQGEKAFRVIANDASSILQRRYILYAADTPQANKTAPQDNMMKAVVRENLGSLATNTARDLSAVMTVQPDTSLAPSDSKAFAWQNVLATLQQIANSAAAATQATPTYLAFDVVCLFDSSTNTSTLEFRTYTSWRGLDHRQGIGVIPVFLSPDAGRFYSSSLAFDYRTERNAITATGNGTGSARATATAQDAGRIAISPFHRIEFVQQAAGIALAATTLQAEANAVLRGSRYQRTFAGHLIQRTGLQYGVNYGLGDIIPVALENTTLNVRLNGIHVSILRGEEKIEAAFTADPLI